MAAAGAKGKKNKINRFSRANTRGAVNTSKKDGRLISERERGKMILWRWRQWFISGCQPRQWDRFSALQSSKRPVRLFLFILHVCWYIYYMYYVLYIRHIVISKHTHTHTHRRTYTHKWCFGSSSGWICSIISLFSHSILFHSFYYFLLDPVDKTPGPYSSSLASPSIIWSLAIMDRSK